MDAAASRVGVLGATSLVGGALLDELLAQALAPVAFTRRLPLPDSDRIQWCSLPDSENASAPVFGDLPISLWVSLAPIWILPRYFDELKAAGAKRIVALSSTSRFTKTTSSVPKEQALARRLADAEAALIEWATAAGIEYVILRPTLIYGGEHDGNVSEISRFIRRFGLFPVFGAARGLRQPVKAADIAAASVAALMAPVAANQAYNLSGGETLTYREMVARVFTSLGLRPRILTVPLGVFRLALTLARRLPRYRHWTVGMAQRMNEDLVFPHDDARRDLGYRPSAFEP
ncbi:NAD-dependent epimerase/dehydratase family protein [Achromobacter seleniivolatilans]|uniref:NAD-dependent epimerase/dehydratase family protein n=1 Tax=Achromobacter seleniivolatilans TaxID=3047478 RepID=A0ABY9LYG4_9BURK|nr:NAD-dependent epimerase/dehydratase family protein [Achromobacter sp. R39]WMD19383.1 NAD-dependent epimerase/dehydratase family protein [Achromobacter sp. R39]